MPSSVKQIYAIAAGVSLLALLGFVFAPHIFAAWVDAPNNPPTYGATGCSPAPCLEDDFKPITQTAAPQSKIGWLAVGSPTQNAPLYALDATGQVNASGGLCIAGSCQLSWASVVAAGLPVGTSGQTLRYDGTNWLANSNLYNDGTNVGIGTASPKTDPFGAKSLDVNGSAFASVFYDRDNTTYNLDPAGTSVLSSLSMKGTLNIQGGTAGNVLTSDAAGNATWGSPGANYWTLSGTNIYNSNTGNVGIGTTAPTTSLHIRPAGGAEFTEGIKIERGTVPTQYGIFNQVGGWTNLISTVEGGGTYGGFTFQASNNGSTEVERMRINENGDIGIGTTAPASALHLSGDRYATFGPNSTWGANLQVGGNGRVTTNASVASTNGNLHLDSRDGGYGTYINYYSNGPTLIGALGGAVGIGNGAGGGYPLRICSKNGSFCSHFSVYSTFVSQSAAYYTWACGNPGGLPCISGLPYNTACPASGEAERTLYQFYSSSMWDGNQQATRYVTYNCNYSAKMQLVTE